MYCAAVSARSGGRLRIVVQLADASDGRHVWSDRFEGELDGVFAIQDQVTAQVAGSIAPALQVVEIDRARRKPPESLSAYELYLRAVPRFRRSLAENREAIRLLRKATELDPDYGAAYGFASRCYQFQKLLGWVAPVETSLAEGIRLAHLAVDIGQNDSEALWMAGHALAHLAGESERGIALIERSLVLNPNSANAWVSSCRVRSYIGDARTAVEHFARAQRLNPLNSMQHVGWNVLALAYLSAGDVEEAARAADKAVNAAPWYAPALRMKVIAYGSLAVTTKRGNTSIACSKSIRTKPWRGSRHSGGRRCASTRRCSRVCWRAQARGLARELSAPRSSAIGCSRRSDQLGRPIQGSRILPPTV